MQRGDMAKPATHQQRSGHNNHQRDEAHTTNRHQHDATDRGSDHGAHVDHTGHEQMFRNRFWVCLALTIPVLLYSPMLQEWFGFAMPTFVDGFAHALTLLLQNDKLRHEIGGECLRSNHPLFQLG
jgi:Ni/Co efflux regulator RcnB